MPLGLLSILVEAPQGEVYGHTFEEEKEKERECLQERVEIKYWLYAVNPFIVSPKLSSLFTNKSKQERKRMDRESMDCWLQSVKEAKRHQIVSQQSLTKLPKYLKPRVKPPLSPGSHCTTEHPDSSTVLVSLSDCSSIVESICDFDNYLTSLSSDIDPG
jgi:hypothetical protein